MQNVNTNKIVQVHRCQLMQYTIFVHFKSRPYCKKEWCWKFNMKKFSILRYSESIITSYRYKCYCYFPFTYSRTLLFSLSCLLCKTIQFDKHFVRKQHPILLKYSHTSQILELEIQCGVTVIIEWFHHVCLNLRTIYFSKSTMVA